MNTKKKCKYANLDPIVVKTEEQINIIMKLLNSPKRIKMPSESEKKEIFGTVRNTKRIAKIIKKKINKSK